MYSRRRCSAARRQCPSWEAYGVVDTSLAGTLSGLLTTPFGNVPFARSDFISDKTWGFGDLIPVFQLRWNAGVHNYMTYITGDIPIGAYQSTRLSNIGIGHGAIDAGAGYTYFNPQTGHEFSGVLGFTYNFKNTATQYQNGVDMHFDWGASQFLSKEVMVGLVGYVYKEIGCDSGSGDRVGCFQSQVFGVGPQIGFLFPVGDMQGYLNFKGLRGIRRREPARWLECLGHLLYLTARARSAPGDKAHRQKILASIKLRLVSCFRKAILRRCPMSAIGIYGLRGLLHRHIEMPMSAWVINGHCQTKAGCPLFPQ